MINPVFCKYKVAIIVLWNFGIKCANLLFIYLLLYHFVNKMYFAHDICDMISIEVLFVLFLSSPSNNYEQKKWAEHQAFIWHAPSFYYLNFEPPNNITLKYNITIKYYFRVMLFGGSKLRFLIGGGGLGWELGRGACRERVSVLV